MKANYVGFMVAISGAMFTTMGHYFSEWIVVYALCIPVGLVTSIVIGDIK